MGQKNEDQEKTLIRIGKHQERQLFRGLVDGTLTSEEFAEVELRLLTDIGFRERYIRAIDIEGHLYEAFSLPALTSPRDTISATIFRAKRPLTVNRIRMGLIVAACAMVVVGFYRSFFHEPELPPGIAATSLVQSEQKPVAIVTHVNQLGAGPASILKPGLRIKPGVLNIENGQVQVEFINGAVINLEGPAALRILSVDAATLESGKAAVRVPPEASGFVLNAPDATIVDLGTEFAVSVGKHGESELHVVEGEVDVSLIGKDGNTLTSQRVSESNSLRVNREPAALQRIDSPSVALPGILPQIAPTLNVPDQYVREVRASNPEIYWRFENVVDGRVPNEVGPRWSAIIHSHPDDSSSIAVANGAVRFTPGAQPHHLEPDELVRGFNSGSFSVELWVSPDKFHRATLVAAVPAAPAPRNRHLCLIEMLNKSSLVHAPGSFRFLHRHPPGENGGFNLFSNGDCTPGLWHHLVAVRTPTDMKLYVNGDLIRQLTETTSCDEAPYRLLIGQLYESGSRPLSGAIDELAVYLRRLQDEEVRAHFRAMSDTGPR